MSMLLYLSYEAVLQVQRYGTASKALAENGELMEDSVFDELNTAAKLEHRFDKPIYRITEQEALP